MRVWLAAAANRSASGEQIWRTRVVGSTFRRSPALRESFAQSSIRVLAERNGIGFPAVAITTQDERANRYLIRIVKGLLTALHPEFDYSAQVFKIDHLNPSRDAIETLTNLGFTYDERGNEVFGFFRQVVIDPPIIGLGSWCSTTGHGSWSNTGNPKSSPFN